ncbi:MAG: hypothetical protein Kow00128_18290 [Deltaproteobacteria bacterium]
MKKGPAGRPRKAIADGLAKALQNEAEGREFYRMAEKSARTDGTRQMFAFLREEEERHYELILAQRERVADGKAPRLVRPASGKKAIRTFSSPIFTPEFVARGKRAEGEAAALSIGMTLEKQAIAQFTALRRKAAGDPAAENLFDGLIAWEREHLELLTRQFEQLRRMFWEGARFWPF